MGDIGQKHRLGLVGRNRLVTCLTIGNILDF